jgi:hypothetical protein
MNTMQVPLGKRSSKLMDDPSEDPIGDALRNLHQISGMSWKPVLGSPMPSAEKHLKEEILHKLSSHGKWHPRRVVLTADMLAFAMEDGDVMIDCVPVLEIAEGTV